MNIGDHLVTPRTVYSHHGIYLGSGKVIHYSGFSNGFSKGEIAITSIINFTQGNGFSVKKHSSRKYSRKKSVKRACSRIGENSYHLFSNNCEHFINWCINGVESSSQVEGTVITVAVLWKLFYS